MDIKDVWLAHTKWLSCEQWAKAHAVFDRRTHAHCGVATPFGWDSVPSDKPHCKNCERELERIKKQK